ncbi:MAG: SpoIIE family protein phosphatase, partial [Clostridiales bacterium]|nr:SpoIIE family protein phosphatase [Clostridiales bacterium]
SKGLVLGAMEDSQYHSCRVRLVAGDKLLLYTDGATEAENVKGAFLTSGGFKSLMDSSPLRKMPAEKQP